MLQLDFYLPVDRDPTSLFNLYLHTCRARMPSALPTRFDAGEPLKNLFDSRDGEPLFLTMVGQQGVVPVGGILFWRSSPPFKRGSVFFGDRRRDSYHMFFRDNPNRHRVRPATHLNVSLTATKALKSERDANDVCGFFTDMCRTIQPFFAATSLLHGSVTRGPSWIGLPETPTWLAWYGELYVDAVSPDAVDATRFDKGMLVRRGRMPATTEAAAAHPIQAAARFVAQYNVHPPVIADAVPEAIPFAPRALRPGAA